MTKRAAIYARVSTDDQADRGYSLPSQLEACRRYAENLGYSVVAELSEDASGATPMTQRRQGARLSELIARREIDVAIVHQVDRLSCDLVDLLVTVRTWLKAGIEIYGSDIGKIESENDIILVIRGWQGTDERKKIRERVMRGKYTKAKSGKVIGSRPPFGYQHVRDDHGRLLNFEIIDDQAKIVRLIYKWYVEGDETGKRLSTRAIARKLSSMGIEAPGEQKGNYPAKIRISGMWHPNAITRLLSQEAYAGTWHYGMEIAHTGKKRSAEDWVDIEVPAIVDRETWDKVQELKPINKAFSFRNSKHEYLLHGLVTCGYCGSSMSGDFFSGHPHYECCYRSNHNYELGEKQCLQKTVRADAIEYDVWEGITGIFSNPGLGGLLRRAQQEELEQLDPKREELAAVEGMIAKAEKDAFEIGEALQHARGIVEKSLEEKQTLLNMRYDAMIARRDTLKNDLNIVQLSDKAIESILDFAEDVKVGIENADHETKRRILEWMKVRITVKDQHYWAECLAGKWDADITQIPYGGELTPTQKLQLRHP